MGLFLAVQFDLDRILDWIEQAVGAPTDRLR
jgi:hypothetical protein